MVESAKERLLTLLFSGENRELVNIKFFPGTDPNLTADDLCAAAHAALSKAMSGELVDCPPVSGRMPVSVRELVASL